MKFSVSLFGAQSFFYYNVNVCFTKLFVENSSYQKMCSVGVVILKRRQKNMSL
jgi:hypothetical protein